MVLLAQHQNGTKHGRSCRCSKRSLDDLLTALPWARTTEATISQIFPGTFWKHGRTKVAGISRFGGDVTYILGFTNFTAVHFVTRATWWILRKNHSLAACTWNNIILVITHVRIGTKSDFITDGFVVFQSSSFVSQSNKPLAQLRKRYQSAHKLNVPTNQKVNAAATPLMCILK